MYQASRAGRLPVRREWSNVPADVSQPQLECDAFHISMRVRNVQTDAVPGRTQRCQAGWNAVPTSNPVSS